MLRAVKYRIYPNKEQQALFQRYFAACRYVYNIALEVKIYAYRAHGVSLSSFDLTKQLTEAKKEHTWLKDYSAQTLEAEIDFLDKAYKQFFSRGGFPRYKGKFDRQSCSFRQNCKLEDNAIILPKFGRVKAIIHRQLDGPIKRITISKTGSGKYFAAAIVDTPDTTLQLLSTGKSVGVDLGVINLVNLHDNINGHQVNIGTIIINGKSESVRKQLLHLQQKIRRVQRHLSRKQEHRKKDKQKRSNRQEKCRLRLARLKEQEAFIRENFLHNVSATLTNQYDTICIEDLKVKNMSRSAKGTVEKPGKNVKAKQGLNRVIVGSGFGMLRTQLEYKAEQKGRKVIAVKPHNTSKTCNNCGQKNDKLGSKRRWTCNNCGTTLDRDANAAKNILDAGLASSAVYVDYSRRAERNSRIKSVKKVSDEAIIPKNSAIKNRRKQSVVTITAKAGVNDG